MKQDWDFERDPLAALRQGKRSPFEGFVRAETGTFLAFFLRLGASRAEAEDLVQDVFLKLYQSADRYRERGAFSGFAFRVARNAWIDRRRALGARPPPEDAAVDALARSSEPGDALDREEFARRLRDALEELPEGQRRVFELGVVQELPYPEIADALAIPVGTVKSRMFHAVRRLRGLLGEVQT